MTNVLIADDHPIILRAMSEIVDAEPGLKIVATARNGAEALEILESMRPDIILTDLDMPEVDGIALISEATKKYSIPCIALTTFGSTKWVIDALRAGASGYVLKDARPEDIVDSIARVLADEVVLAPEVSKLLVERTLAVSSGMGGQADSLPSVSEIPPVREQTRTEDLSQAVTHSGFTNSRDSVSEDPTVSDALAVDREDEDTQQNSHNHSLTEREIEVVRLLAGGLSNKEIAAELFLSEGTVKLHLGKACDRLGARDRVQLIVRACELGVVQPKLLHPETAQDRYK